MFSSARRIIFHGAKRPSCISNTQKRTVFNMRLERWKKPFSYVIEDSKIKYMIGEAVQEEIDLTKLEKLGIRHESSDYSKEGLVQWVFRIEEMNELITTPHDEVLTGHKEMVEKLQELPNFDYFSYAKALTSRTPTRVPVITVWDKHGKPSVYK
eukprot:TRINITY_DN3217_c0_g1_i2.p2 TRINITY_DN3217_c0_g1~~TRINITY_DN3217_c0_g1_i2.p2  ORF type:complete len:154 (+),score=21.81 TRINITY_DN3217_c0_g1_i2:92-553(+)